MELIAWELAEEADELARRALIERLGNAAPSIRRSRSDDISEDIFDYGQLSVSATGAIAYSGGLS